MKLLHQPLFLFLAIIASPGHAADPWTPSDAEMASLPPFCKAKLNPDSSGGEYKMWANTLGKDFEHTHHYCVGINFINRYYRSRSPQDKRFNLNNALGNLNYMVNHASPNYSLMPDVYLNRGLVYSLQKQHGRAIADLQKAIELNPRQAKAYNVLADYYVSMKMQTKALETVTQGLRHSPDTTSLQRRYGELGGKLPYPEPVLPAKAEPPPTGAAIESASEAPAEITLEPSEVDAVSVPKPTEQPKIGTPKNPYCRFCPD